MVLANCIQTPYAVSDSISVLRVSTNRQIMITYAPSLVVSADDKDSFYRRLEDTIQDSPTSKRTILIGDLNARVGSDYSSWSECLGNFGVGKINDNGNKLCVINTLSHGKAHKKVSWCHPCSKTWHQLYFVIISQKHRREVVNTWTYQSPHIALDEKPAGFEPNSDQQGLRGHFTQYHPSNSSRYVWSQTTTES